MSLSHPDYWSRLAKAFDGMVHPCLAEDPIERTVHRDILAARLCSALLALTIFPLYMLLSTGLTPLYAGLFAVLFVPVVSAMIQSLTGRLDWAAMTTAVALMSLVFLLAPQTGGVVSPFALLLLVMPFEALVSQDKRLIVGLSLFSILGCAILGITVGADVVALSDFIQSSPWLVIGVAISALMLPWGSVFASLSRAQRLKSALLKREGGQKFLTENVADIVTRHHGSGFATYVSPASSRLLDCPGETLLGRAWLNAIHPADRNDFLSAMREADNSSEDVTIEFRMRRARIVPVEMRDYASDQDFLWVEMRCRKTRADEGLGEDIIAITRDITVHKIQEQALENAREEAEGANRAKTRFLASMSHELRTPLNAIIGFSEILDNEVFGPIGPPRNKEYVKLIHESGTHLLTLVNDILDTSKIESGKYQVFCEPFVLKPLIKSCCALVMPEADSKALSVTTRSASEMPELIADKRAVKQILINLLSNAVKFTPENGRIHIETSYDDHGISIRVSDTGIGIAPDDLTRIGKPFVQADTTYSREHNGTGLGLSVVRGLVDLHKGDLEIESEPGLGTTVTVAFPRNVPDDVNSVMARRRASNEAYSREGSEADSRKIA